MRDFCETLLSTIHYRHFPTSNDIIEGKLHIVSSKQEQGWNERKNPVCTSFTAT